MGKYPTLGWIKKLMHSNQRDKNTFLSPACVIFTMTRIICLQKFYCYCHAGHARVETLGKFVGPGSQPVLSSRIMSFNKLLFLCADSGTPSINYNKSHWLYSLIVDCEIFAVSSYRPEIFGANIFMNKTGLLPGPANFAIVKKLNLLIIVSQSKCSSLALIVSSTEFTIHGIEIQLFFYITNSRTVENENGSVSWSILIISSYDAVFSNILVLFACQLSFV